MLYLLACACCQFVGVSDEGAIADCNQAGSTSVPTLVLTRVKIKAFMGSRLAISRAGCDEHNCSGTLRATCLDVAAFRSIISAAKTTA